MRTSIACFFVLVSASLLSQVPNRTETNCAGFERSVYAAGDQGKPLIVASKGLDCSICMNGAPAVGAFAAEHFDEVEVWGAMTNLYNPAEPTCPGIGNWVETYAWSSVFAFRDLDEYWVGSGFPTYYVIHPTTREIIYEGPNWNMATNAALDVVLGVDGVPSLEDAVTVFATGNELKIYMIGLESGWYEISVYNLSGQLVADFQTSVYTQQKDFSIPFTERDGIYVLRVSKEGEQATKKFLVSH
jgi:hypothetical protein